jgi:Permuted papain-like amidase enzyme, YaeF/YiiX, C92 family
MKFSTVAELIRDGDVFLFRGTALHSRVIEWWSRSRFSHVGIAWWIHSGEFRRLVIIEALEPGGVRVFPMDTYLEQCARQKCQVDWYAITDTSIDRQKVVAHALSKWGCRYASWRQFLISFGGLTPWIRGRLGKPVLTVSPDRFFCSQLAAEAMYAGGYVPDEVDERLPVGTDPGEVSLFPCLTRRGPLTLGG